MEHQEDYSVCPHRSREKCVVAWGCSDGLRLCHCFLHSSGPTARLPGTDLLRDALAYGNILRHVSSKPSSGRVQAAPGGRQ